MQSSLPRLAAGWLAALGLALATLPGARLPQQPEPQKIRIVAQRFHFTPSKLKLPSGTQLEITLESRDTFHGFHLKEGGIDVVIPARGRGSVRVLWRTPDEPGRYEFACSKPCGAGHAQMRGAIIVE